MKARLPKLSQPITCLTLIIMLCLFTIALQSCSKTTSPKTGKLTGTVSLIDDTPNAPLQQEIDYSGITVAIYQTTTLDTTITRINRDYPNLGVLINQETEFDHRLQSPVRVTTTNETGSFTLSNINKGKYNLVIFKEGWGVRYLCDLMINKDSQTLDELINQKKSLRDSIELYPVRTLSGYVYEPYIFEANHSYVITDDVSMQGNVEFQASAYIWIAPTKSINIDNGMIKTSNPDLGFTKITTSYNMYETSISTITPSNHYFYSVLCSSYASFYNNQLSSVVTTFSKNGWDIRIPGVAISNIVLRDNDVGLQCNQVSNISISNSNVSYSKNSKYGGFAISNSNGIDIQRLIVTKCVVGVSQDNCPNANISESYFYANTSKDIFNSFFTTGNVAHCTMDRSHTAIHNSGNSNTNVQYCNIISQIGIDNSQASAIASAYFTANQNNLFCSLYGLRTTAEFGLGYHINGKNNYWGTTDTQAIYSNLIYDKTDANVNDPEYEYYGIIDFLPIKYSKVSNAGVTQL